MSLHADIIGILRTRNLTIAFAESCTGGRLSADLTTVPGSSDVVAGSAVCYQTRIKNLVLGLDHVNDDNAVSETTVADMAHVAMRLYKSQVGVGTTGYLDGDDRHAFFAIVYPSPVDGKLNMATEEIRFDDETSRADNRNIVVSQVMTRLAQALREDT